MAPRWLGFPGRRGAVYVAGRLIVREETGHKREARDRCLFENYHNLDLIGRPGRLGRVKRANSHANSTMKCSPDTRDRLYACRTWRR